MGHRHGRLARVSAGLALLVFGIAPATQTTAAVANTSSLQPAVSDYVQVSSSDTPPTTAQCASVGRRCFSPQAVRAAYNLQPLYDAGNDGTGTTIAVVDSYGSDTMAHDLHVYDQAFGLPPMCGEEGVTCTSGMPTFTQLH